MLSPLYGQLFPLRIPTKAARIVQDTDALAYIAAVENADAQTLEDGVKFAYEDFIVGCKSDGIWSAIKASCILAGARTLSGALVPLVGTAPTNNNFVSGDYNRKTGLLGNGTTKYLNSNRSATADPQNNAHFSVFVSTPGTTGRYYLAQFTTSTTPQRYDYLTSSISVVIKGDSNIATNLNAGTSGLIAASRSSSSQATYRINKNSSTVNNTSKAVDNLNLFIFARNVNGSLGTGLSNGRLSFHSIGESLNLALLDIRVSTLMSSLAAAIDADVYAYIAAVEAADGQPLEQGIKDAYTEFITGCKSDGIWSAIKASCILAGARTLSGALVPLTGTAPTNFNFVSADYDRKTGLKGNGSTKYLNSNRANNADPQNSKHIFSYLTEKFVRGGNQTTIGRSGTGGSSLTQGPSGQTFFRSNYSTETTFPNGVSYPLGGWGVSRTSASSVNYIFRNDGSGSVFRAETGTLSSNSTTPISTSVNVFGNTGLTYTAARLSFYSIGENLDLAALDTRVSTLITAIAAAIP